jgi:hypothetical protein
MKLLYDNQTYLGDRSLKIEAKTKRPENVESWNNISTCGELVTILWTQVHTQYVLQADLKCGHMSVIVRSQFYTKIYWCAEHKFITRLEWEAKLLLITICCTATYISKSVDYASAVLKFFNL